MSIFTTKSKFQKIISLILALFMILPVIPAFDVSAAVSGITYYEHNFELPLYGATGCVLKDVSGITAGTAFTILAEEGNNLSAKLSNGTETTIAKEFCMINLPDIIPSIKYDITNSYSSVFKIRGANIAGITGQSLYQNGTSKKNNPRLGKDEFLVPVLYETAIKLAAAQKKALSEDYSLVVYEAYRPTYAQDKVYAAYSPLVTDGVRGDYPVSWFIASGKSNHQEGYAVDLSLAKVTASSFTALSNSKYKIANLTVTNCEMITPIHDLTVDSAVYNYQSGMVIYDKTAWQSYTKTAAFGSNADSQRLQKYCTDAGLTPFAAEWWHFNDVDARNALGSLTSVTGNWELTANMSIIQAADTAAVTKAAYYDYLMVYADEDIPTSVLNYNGNRMWPGAYIIADGVKYPAFCIDPMLYGADFHPNGQYPVNVNGTNLSAKVATVLHNSVPYATKEDILEKFPGLTDLQIYAATKAAIRAVAEQSAADYPDDNAWGGDAQTVAFAKYLINLARNATEDSPKSAIFGTSGTSDVYEEDGYFVRTTTVQSSNYPLAEGEKIHFTIPAEAPAGTVITYEDDTPIPADGVENKTTIKIKVPVSSVPEDTSGSFDIIADMYIYSQVILFGVPVDAGDIGTYQRYEISMPKQPAVFNVPMEYRSESKEEEPEYGGLKILKYDNVTGNLVAGAIFEVKGLDSGNNTIMFQVQASSGASVPAVENEAEVTVGDGTVSVSGIPAGKYQITEIAPPPNYDKSPDGYYSQVVEVQASTEATVYPQAAFRNNPYGSLKVTKIDAVTGQPVAGATLRIRNEIAGIDITRTTDASGIISLEDLPQGNYSITEVNAGADYELSPLTVVVPVRWGQLAEAAFDNQPHTSFEVTKINGKTNQPVSGAVFTLKELSTGKEWTLGTLADGKAIVSNIPAGNYTLKEIFVPEPLILNSTVINIQIDNDKINSYTAVNDEKPIVTLEKYDEKTSQLIGGAEFRLERLDGAWQTEFMVDSSGTKTLTVNPGTYRFTEIAAPDGYLIVTKHKDFVLNPNDEITIKFDNRPRPALEIKKIDTITGEALSGARFKVTKTEDLTVSEYITDSTGTILIENLDEAIYTVEEIIAPEGYILDSQKKEIQLEWGKTKTLIYEDIRKPTLILTKTNALTFAPIPNTTFKVEYEDANGGVRTLGTYRTDENGQIILPKVDAGWYIFTEIVAAPGYSLPSNPVTRKYLAPGENAYTNTTVSGQGGDISGDNIMVMSGSEFLLGQEILDYPLNSIVIRKVNSVTGELLAGARFQVRRVTEETSGSGGTVIGEYTTDNSGVIIITGLLPGGYIIEEVKAPENYLLSENSQQQVWLKYDGTSIVESTFANVPYGSILITKVDAQTNKPLANARFRVTDGSGAVAGNTNGEFVTDENGEALVANIKPGSYVITEIEAPANYVVDTTPQTVNVGVDGKTYKVSFKNQPTGTLVIRKYDSVSREPLADAEFKVTTSGGDVVGTSNGIFKTDATGTITIPNLPKDSYIVQEIKAPTDYILENQTQTIAVDYGKTYTLDFCNKHMSGLQIIKIDSQTKQPLKGAEFTVYKQSGEIVDRYVTDADGVIIIDTLAPGWYKVVETKTLDGYVLDEIPKDVQITDNQFVKVVLENAPMSSLIIRKVDADTRDPLEGAEFTVKTAGGTLIGVYRSGTDGMVSISQIAPGWYSVTETKAPDGYTLGDNVQTVEITNTKTVTIEFQNRAFGSLVIKKVSEITGDPLTGAEFSVSKQGGAFVGEYATGKDGTISIPNVEPGWYVVSETKAPAGYTLDSTAKTVEVKPVVPSVVTFTNKPLSGIEIIKTDSVTHNPLANATFVVERANGEKIGTYKTDVSGKVIVSGLIEGTYVVSETIAPDNYHLNEIPKTVIVVSGKLTTVEFSNKPYSGIQILKTDVNTNAPLQGAVFKIERTNGERIGDKYTTDIAGKIIVPDLEEGVYIISEIQAPNEYVLDAQPQTVEVKSGKLTIVEFVNTPYPYLHIVKTDASTGELLSGAEFVVTNAYGEVIANVISQASGAVSLKVVPGVYTITETKAPAGYENNDPVQTVEVRANGSAVYYGTTTAYPNNTAAFANRPLNAIQILKLDSITHNPLGKALFRVEKSNGDFIGSFLTDSAGSILISGLTEGTYVIKEISAPAGYVLDETPKSISISGGRIVDVDFLNKPLSGIQITKLDAVTGKPLQGAAFTVTKSDGERVGTYRTEADGTVIISDLEPGVYIVGEISAPSGYEIDETPKNVTVVSGRLAAVEFVNSPYSGIEITKIDSVTKVPLSGATFTVERADGAKIGTYKTDSAGKILVNDLPEGTYIVSETAAPSGYVLNDTPKTVNVVSGRLASVEFVNDPYGSLLIKKTDEITARPLAGAHFTVKHQNGASIGDFITDNDGAITIPNLEPGWYVVSETKAPAGYHLDSAAKTIEVTSHAPTSITFTNRPYSGIEIIKTDSVTHNPLSGATFVIERANGEKIGTYKTDASGKIIVPDLTEGTYIVSETIAPSGYHLNETPKTVIVTSGKLMTVEFVNKPYSGMQIFKTDANTNAPLAGAVFKIERVSGERIGDKYTTDIAGKIIVSDLEEGVYIISEIQAPAEYVLDAQPQTVEVKTGKLTIVEFVNTPYPYLHIVKTDASTGQLLSGAEFIVTNAYGEAIANVISQASGAVSLKVAPGIYTVTEVKAPAGYELNDPVQTVEVRANGSAVYYGTGTAYPNNTAAFSNRPLNAIQILKLDSITHKPLSKALFVVEKSDGTRIGSFLTDSAGSVLISGLTEGTYIIKETSAPDGYQLDETPKSISISGGRTVDIDFLNKPLSGIQIIKTDAVTHVPLANATFTVDRSTGERIGIYKTDAAGQILIPDLTEGTYIISETAAPNGYKLDQTPKTVTVVSGRVTMAEFTNLPYGSLIIKKTDEITGRPLAGAHFTVTHQGGSAVGDYITDNDGSIAVPNLEPGWYVVSETKAPNNYHLDSTAKTIEVKSYNPTSITFTNRPYSGIEITKIDSVTKVPLSGATFTVERADGAKIGTYKTDASGKILVSELSEGSYIVSETAAPNGYMLNDTPKTVNVVSGKLASVEFANDPYGSLLIKKTDEITARPLAGAHFTVRHQNGAAVGDFITDNDGAIVIPNLVPGWYVVSETRAPNGYHLDSAAKTIEVTSNAPTMITFTNRPYSGIQILKTDANTNAPLAGAVFKIERVNGERIGDKYTTDIAGKIIVSDLEEGVYIISEIQAPAEYVLDAQPQTVEVKSGKLTIVEFTNTPYPYLHIVKTDASTGQLLSGAEFMVTNAYGEIVANVISQASGAVSLKVAPGIYTITEVKAPAGYENNDPVQTVEVRANGSAVYYGTSIAYPSNTAAFANRPLNAIQILKLDSITHNPLSKALFVVEKSNGDRIGSFLTDSAGSILISGLTEGTYIIKETSAPDGYQLNETPKSISVSGGRTVDVDFLNKPLSGIQITKLDAVTKTPLQGASFTITKANGEKIGTFRTEADGTAVISDLEEGTYIVGEITAPTGYQLDETPKSVNVVSGRLATVEFANKPLSGIQIIKTDSVTHVPLANATFTVDLSNGERIGVYKTDAAGQVIVSDLAEGTYIISETAAPNGYKLDNTPKTVTVVSGRIAMVEFTNLPYGSLVIKKTDEITGRPLAGAHFTVTHQGGSVVGDYITDNDGSITVPNLEPGWYVVSETKAPTNYHLDSAAKTIEVKSYNPTSITFTNRPYSGIEIVKLDAVTHQPLQGAAFTVTKADGERIGTFRTEADGKILIPNLTEGVYIVGEISAPDGYQLDASPKNVTVISGKLVSVEFVNKPYSGIEIIKTDSVTHAPMAGATFTVERVNGGKIGTYKTDTSGKIIVNDLPEGTYVVSETIAPDGYQLDESPKNVTVISGKLATVEFVNKPFSGIEIIKTDAVTHRPLSGATFTVERANGEKIGTYRTDASGKIIVNDLSEGTYIVSETIAPSGYTLDEIPKTVTVKSGKLTTVEFENRPYSGIEIIKLDAIKFTPLAGATFVLERANGEKVGTYRTDWTGKIIIPYLPEGVYIISETIAPSGYTLDEIPKTVTVTSGKLTTVEFTNRPLSGIEIIKIDAVTKAPLMGATFVVERPNGEKIGTYKTDAAGKIIVNGLTEGTYIISETIAPDGYILSETPKTVVVTSGKLTEVEFTNKRLSGIEIIKLNAQTNAPLPGATFVVERDNGEKIGAYKTDSTGKIIVNDLTEGTYIVSETIAPDGFILDEAPKTVIVKSGKLTVVEFLNKPLAGLKIIKLDSVTRNPIEGVEFEITKMNGEKIENDFRGYNFKTDKIGQIYIPRLEDGYYTVTETRTVDGYILDGEPKTVLIQSGKTTVLEVENTPMSGLLIVKTDANTGKPLADVVFDIKRADGAFVAGNILDGNQPNTANNSPNKTTSPNGDITGSYTTDSNGRILLNGLSAGQYTVTERKALTDYELDTNVYNVTVLPGKLATLQLTNTPKAGIRIIKIDSVTKKPIYAVEFMLFDSNNKVVGTYITDNNGVVEITGIPEGRYTIRETRAAAGYYLDEIPKTIEFTSGKITEIQWENTPKMAQIQITKKSGDDNEINGLPAGTVLAGAVFEAYDYKTGNLVDRFVSGKDGRAISKALPLGRYVVKEVQAPQYYKLSDRELDIDLEFATQIVKLEYLNYSANTGVSIKKTGNVEAMSGDVIRYDIKEVRNTGTVPLTDFYWRDVLPVDAVRLTKIVTGTYNQSLKYKVMATTNKGNTKVIADNLSTTKNNVIDCSNASLGLKNDEFVTSFTLMFGTVKAGFSQVETPQIYVKVQPNLPNGYQFANKVDCAGKNGKEWVSGSSTWLTTIYAQPGKLPKTGY